MRGLGDESKRLKSKNDMGKRREDNALSLICNIRFD